MQYFQLPVETIGSRFGKISSMIPSPTMPLFDFEIIKNLLRPATTIAILAGIESLLACVVADGMIGSKHRSNMELVAQGVANIASPLLAEYLQQPQSCELQQIFVAVDELQLLESFTQLHFY